MPPERVSTQKGRALQLHKCKLVFGIHVSVNMLSVRTKVCDHELALRNLTEGERRSDHERVRPCSCEAWLGVSTRVAGMNDLWLYRCEKHIPRDMLVIKVGLSFIF